MTRAETANEEQNSLDTYARILYKIGKREHAIAVQTEAVALQSKQGFPTKEFDKILLNMKAGKEKIDEY